MTAQEIVTIIVAGAGLVSGAWAGYRQYRQDEQARREYAERVSKDARRDDIKFLREEVARLSRQQEQLIASDAKSRNENIFLWRRIAWLELTLTRHNIPIPAMPEGFGSDYDEMNLKDYPSRETQ